MQRHRENVELISVQEQTVLQDDEEDEEEEDEESERQTPESTETGSTLIPQKGSIIPRVINGEKVYYIIVSSFQIQAFPIIMH